MVRHVQNYGRANCHPIDGLRNESAADAEAANGFAFWLGAREHCEAIEFRSWHSDLHGTEEF